MREEQLGFADPSFEIARLQGEIEALKAQIVAAEERGARQMFKRIRRRVDEIMEEQTQPGAYMILNEVWCALDEIESAEEEA